MTAVSQLRMVGFRAKGHGLLKKILSYYHHINIAPSLCYHMFLSLSERKQQKKTLLTKGLQKQILLIHHPLPHFTSTFQVLHKFATPCHPKKPNLICLHLLEKAGLLTDFIKLCCFLFNSVPFNTPTMLLYFRCKLYPCHLLHHISDNQPIAYSHVIRLLSSLRNTACLGFQGHTQQITSKVREDWETSARFFPSL